MFARSLFGPRVFVKSSRVQKNRTDFRRRNHSAARIERLELRALLTGLVWSSGPNLPTALGGPAAIDTGLGVLVAGGTSSSNGNSTPASAHILDPTSNTWITAPNLDQGHFAGGVGATGSYGPIVNTGEGPGYKYASDIFFYGGANQGSVSADVANYDVYGTEGTTSAPSLPVARYKFAYVTDPSTGQLYAIGGLNSSQQALSSVAVYDPVADSWSLVAPLPQALSGASAASDGAGHLLVFGGINSSGQPVNSVYSYTLATGTWSAVSTMPIAASGTAAVYGAFGQIYVIGGRTAGGAVSSVYVFNPVTNQWDAETSLPSAEYGASAVIDQNGNLDVIGGFNSAGNPVSSLYQSPALAAPVGLPTVPTISFDNLWLTYNGAPQPVTATAIGADGYTSIDGTFTYTYNGSSTAPTSAGTYNVLAYFTSNDPQYVDTVTSTTLDIGQATPTISLTGGGTITYDGLSHPISATEVGVDGATPVAGSFTYTYNDASSAPVNPGSYTAVATFTSADPNYTGASASTNITIPDPTIPTGITAVGASTTSVQISWNPVPGAAYYNVYKRVVIHNPKGSGSTIHWSIVAGNVAGTSAVISIPYFSSLTMYVTSVSGAGVQSPPSTTVSAQTLYAPSLYNFLWNGAVMSSASLQVGQTLQVTLLGYGNLSPTYTLDSGPANLSVDANSGVVTFSPVAGEVGTFYATFTATNSVGSSTATFAFTVGPSQVLGDWNQDGSFSGADVSAMSHAVANLPLYQATYGLTDAQLVAMGDTNHDGSVTNADLQSLINLLIHSAAQPAAAISTANISISGANIVAADASAPKTTTSSILVPLQSQPTTGDSYGSTGGSQSDLRKTAPSLFSHDDAESESNGASSRHASQPGSGPSTPKSPALEAQQLTTVDHFFSQLSGGGGLLASRRHLSRVDLDSLIDWNSESTDHFTAPD